MRAGLCDACMHRRLVRGRRSSFLLCGLSREDPRFPRYPRLPVLACDGFMHRELGGETQDETTNPVGESEDVNE